MLFENNRFSQYLILLRSVKSERLYLCGEFSLSTPEIDYGTLEKAGIYIFGKRLKF